MANKYVEYIRYVLDERTLLEQLAEESAEFTQAVLKLIRAADLNNNSTPVTKEQAIANIVEEFKDITLCLYMIDATEDENALDNPKLKRWAERVGYVDE